MNYVTAFKKESFGGRDWGIEIRISDPERKLTEPERFALCKAAEEIEEAVMRETISRDLKEQAKKVDLTAKVHDLFRGTSILLEEVPNEYCSRACCSMSPWFVVTAPAGRFRVGWRKRVIHLEWTDTCIGKTAAELFPAEDVTKEGKVIHCWSWEKAVEYIGKLKGFFPPANHGSVKLGA